MTTRRTAFTRTLMMRHRATISPFLPFAVIGFCASLLGSEVAAAAQHSPGKNLAVGATYECVVPPNYWGWKDPQHGDHGQLVDGSIVEKWDTGQGLIYSLPSSMGWSGIEPIVVFDLGEIRSIEGIGLHTVNSLWGPWWPDTVAVLVSDDNEHYSLAGPAQTITPERLTPKLSRQALQAGIDRKLVERGFEPTTHWYRTPALKAHGRYVALIMTLPSSTGTVVMDEIEIYSGPESELQTPRFGPVFSEGKAGWQSYKLYKAISERLSRDIAALKAQIERSPVPITDRQPLLTDLAGLEGQIGGQPIPKIADFRAIFPVNDLHRQIFAVHAALWRAQGMAPLSLWKTHRWDPLTPFEDPSVDQQPRLEITMAQNAVGSDVFNLSNSTDQPLTVELRLSDLPADNLDLFEVPLVDTQTYEPVASALVALASDEGVYRVTIPSGMTRQVWARCSSRELEARRYEGSVKLSTRGGTETTAEIPVTIEVVKVRLPDHLSLYLGGWDYPFPGTYQVTAENVDQYVAILKEYGVNVTWGSGYMGMGEYDADGNLIAEPSRQEVDQWLAYWPNAELYCAVAGGLYGRPEKEVIAWAKDWSSYMSSHGVPPEKIAVLIKDEPISPEEFEKILQAGRAVRQGEPQFKIFNDIHVADPMQAPPILDSVMREACNIQCSNVGFYFDKPQANEMFMKKYNRPDLQWWCYTGGQADRNSDPYVAWLLRSWFCFDQNLTGAHWWAFGDGNTGFSWNEYVNSGPALSPLYLARDSVTPSKSIEAMREGAQDYELLQMLKQKAAEQNSVDHAARQLLEHDVQRVLQAHRFAQWSWKAPKDRSVADQVRIKALRLLGQMALVDESGTVSPEATDKELKQ